MHKQVEKTIKTLNEFNKALQHDLLKLKGEYDELWKTLITIVHAYPDQELRIHESQFLRFKEEYRMLRSFDEETKEVVFKLKTLTD